MQCRGKQPDFPRPRLGTTALIPMKDRFRNTREPGDLNHRQGRIEPCTLQSEANCIRVIAWVAGRTCATVLIGGVFGFQNAVAGGGCYGAILRGTLPSDDAGMHWTCSIVPSRRASPKPSTPDPAIEQHAVLVKLTSASTIDGSSDTSSRAVAAGSHLGCA